MPRIHLMFIALSLIMASCNQEEKPLTKEEAVSFAKKIELSIDRREGTMLDEAFDEKAFIKKMNLEKNSESRSFQSGMREAFKIGTKLCTSLAPKGSYSFIKHYEKDKVHHILFRLYQDKSINYHDFQLKRTNGQPKIVDMYIYMTGQNLSETIKNLYGEFKDRYQQSTNDEPEQWLKRLPDIRSLLAKGKHQEALDIYNSIPQKVKKVRTFQVVHVEICSGLTEEEYIAAIDEYEKLYPNEPNMQLLKIDGYIMRKDYNKALDAINQLDNMIDKDPLLDYHRAGCYTLLNENTKRTEHLEKLVKNLPYFEDGLLALIGDYLESGEFEKADPLVRRFKNKSAFDQSQLKTLLAVYPGYNKKYGIN